jgi:hypothetical protein
MFGWRRREDEDPFAALRGDGTYQSTPTVLPSDPPTPDPTGLTALAAPTEIPTAPPPPLIGAATQLATTTQAPPRPPRAAVRLQPRIYRGGSSWLRPLIILIFIAVIVIPVLATVVKTGNSISSDLKGLGVPRIGSLNTAPVAPQGGQPARGGSGKRARPSPRPASYLTAAGLTAGLRHVAKVARGARLTLLRIDADSLSTIAVPAHGASKEVYFGPNGTLVTGGASTGERPVPISAITPAAVTRIVAAMGSRFHVRRNRIDYMVISSIPGLPAEWIVFSKAPSHPGYAATLAGTGLHPLGG